jgi:hypothetical protein
MRIMRWRYRLPDTLRLAHFGFPSCQIDPCSLVCQNLDYTFTFLNIYELQSAQNLVDRIP